MKFGGYKLIFVAVGLIGVLLIATPALIDFIRLPAGGQFSELYLLGSGPQAENYPFNIAVGQNYSVDVSVGNHLGSSASYVLYVKFQNENDMLPNSTAMTPSPVPPLYEYRFSTADGNTWESPLAFSVSNATISANQAVVETLMINGFNFNVDKLAIWDSNSATFTYRMVFELWLYNATSNSDQFNDRFVELNLNLTQAS
ncbi:MAG: DUF1616 domain-containing protein [Candidatus Bathyarchaeia archaeon]|jgi:hypothetical protein